jgi:hypothetical protein
MADNYAFGDGNGGTNQRMTLILRTMKKHMGWDDAKDDYAVLDGEKTVGRIYKEHGEARWFWSVNTSLFPLLLLTTVSPSHWKRRKASSSNDMKR